MQFEEDLATLIYVQNHGNDSLINYTKNTNQSGIELADSSTTSAQNNANSSANTGAIEINWGDFDLGSSPAPSSSMPANIESKPAEILVESAPIEIKWDIDVSGAGSAATEGDISNFEITIENEGPSSLNIALYLEY